MNNEILHDTIYEWDGTSKNGRQPICWWAGSYRIRIIDLVAKKPGIVHLKSKAVIFKNRGNGTSVKQCIQNFAKALCQTFDIEITKALWVEVEHLDSTDIQVANLTPVTVIGGNRLFSATWRPIRPKEKAILEPYLDGLEIDPQTPAA